MDEQGLLDRLPKQNPCNLVLVHPQLSEQAPMNALVGWIVIELRKKIHWVLVLVLTTMINTMTHFGL